MDRNKLQHGRQPDKTYNDKAQHCIKITFQEQLIHRNAQLTEHQWEHDKSKARRIYPVPFDQFFRIVMKKARIYNALDDPYQYDQSKIGQKSKNL